MKAMRKNEELVIHSSRNSCRIVTSEERRLEELLKTYENRKILILTDRNVEELHLSNIADVLENKVGAKDLIIYVVEPGESSKTFTKAYEICKHLITKKFSKNDLIVNLGGGVISDLGGFVASIYKRGIRYINIPTTLLAQVDASIGGKVGVNIDGLKNCIGSIYLPELVYIDVNFIKTQSHEEIISGFAEILKTALISDKHFNDNTIELIKSKSFKDFEKSDLNDIVLKCAKLKSNIVNLDLYDTNIRQILNFGHTVGHAVEAYMMNDRQLSVTHGRAVAIGMICELYLSYKVLGLSIKSLKSACRSIRRIFSHIDISKFEHAILLRYMQNDKKNDEGALIKFSLLTKLGEATYGSVVHANLIFEALNFYQTNIIKED